MHENLITGFQSSGFKFLVSGAYPSTAACQHEVFTTDTATLLPEIVTILPRTKTLLHRIYVHDGGAPEHSGVHKHACLCIPGSKICSKV